MSSFTRRWGARIAGATVVGGGGLALLACNPTWTNREPSLPHTPLMEQSLKRIHAANKVPFDGQPTASRAKGLEQLEMARDEAGKFDLVIIGGGATGTAVALDAVSRGMRVALIEKGDFACETSSKSTKLIHGGVRYLEKAIFGMNVKQLLLVYEALGERATLMRQAPHICHKLPTVVPCYSYTDAVFYWCGMKAYDLLAAFGSSTLVGSRFADLDETLDMVPQLRRSKGFEESEKLVGSIVYYDGTMDDARLNLSGALTAAAVGAAVVNYCEVTAVQPAERRGPNGERMPPHNIVTVRDRMTGRDLTVHTRFVVSAAGPFADRVRGLLRQADGSPLPESERKRKTVLAAAGAHIALPAFLTTPRHHSAEQAAVLIPKTRDGRVLFIRPFEGVTVAGTTDREVPEPDAPTANAEDVNFIVSAVDDIMAARVQNSDVSSAWCGIRPLAAPEEDEEGGSQNVVREHRIRVEPNGFASVVGGKWTTYRRMGEEVVDAIVHSRVDPAFTTSYGTSSSNASISHLLPLVGAPRWFDPEDATAEAATFWKSADNYSAGKKLDEATKRHLWRSYGVRAVQVLEGAAAAERAGRFDKLPAVLAVPNGDKNAQKKSQKPGQATIPRGAPADMYDRVLPHLPILSAEVLYACRHEMCAAPADFLCRRTRLAFTDARDALAAVDKVAAVMGTEFKWSAEKVALEAERARQELRTFLPTPLPSPVEVANQRRKSLWATLGFV